MSPIRRSKKSTNGRLSTRALRASVQATATVAPQVAAHLGEELFTSPRRSSHPLREMEVLVPARSLSVRDRHLTLAAWEWGEGPTVLLVHGWEGRGAQLGGFVDPLVEAGYRVVAFDVKAHGKSPGHHATLEDWIAGIAAVAEAASPDEPLRGIVAHSFGAAGVWNAIHRGVAVERVVLVAPVGSLRAGVQRFTKILGTTDSVGDELVRRIEQRSERTLDDVDAPRVVPRLEVPLLVLHDRNDHEVPLSEGEALVKQWRGAELIATDGLGHRRLLWDPETVGQAVDFLVERGRWLPAGATEPRIPPETRFDALHYR